MISFIPTVNKKFIIIIIINNDERVLILGWEQAT